MRSEPIGKRDRMAERKDNMALDPAKDDLLILTDLLEDRKSVV